MLRANIKVWMLTGDKLETAENIAKSCRLIQEGFHKITVQSKPSNKSGDPISVGEFMNSTAI